jgi:hypothetical protein
MVRHSQHATVLYVLPPAHAQQLATLDSRVPLPCLVVLVLQVLVDLLHLGLQVLDLLALVLQVLADLPLLDHPVLGHQVLAGPLELVALLKLAVLPALVARPRLDRLGLDRVHLDLQLLAERVHVRVKVTAVMTVPTAGSALRHRHLPFRLLAVTAGPAITVIMAGSAYQPPPRLPFVL